ncbi:MAG TPA: glycosyltransferase family A protein [Smithella sp.]|nr:glycosyltransferase family A protein [Smithella sp.]
MDVPSSNISGRGQVSFSIIMPTYNRKYCIDQAIQSLLSQNYDDFELLIVDDSSTDGTLDHVRAAYPGEIEKGKIRLIPISKTGVSGARNAGLENAKNDWICYLDTDNLMMPSYFETFNRCILENPGCQCFYAKMRLRSSGKVVGKPFSFFELLQRNYIDIGTFVHSKALYRELGGQDVNLTGLEDWDQAIRYTAVHEPYFIDAIVLDYNDGLDDRVSNYAKHREKRELIRAKNILVNIDYLAKNLYPTGSLKWAVKHLLELFFDKIKKIF